MIRKVPGPVYSGICLVLLSFACPTNASDGPENAALAARAVFKKRCAGCHGPNVAKPKGRFGYVLDLQRMAANPERVVPGKPDESELWSLIRNNEMPPGNPLSPDQKETVRAWILTGAPAPPPGTMDDAADSDPTQSTSDLRRWFDDVGRFHLLVLHFPIALLLAAALGDLWGAARQQTTRAAGVRYCISLGAATAVVAAIIGWLYAAAGHGRGSGDNLEWHRWAGTATAAWAIATALIVEQDARKGKQGSLSQLMILVGAALVSVAAYYGGELVHGNIFRDW